jgi:hypothetical protein
MIRVLPIHCLIFLFCLDAGQRCFAAALGLTSPTDPVAYCAAVRNIDSPVGGASPIPAALKPYVARVFRLPADSAIVPENYFWRCMSGAVYVCAVGANIPCDAKADRARRNLGAEHYCRENPDATFVPAFATGHASIYSWSCSAGQALPGKRLAKIDKRGFRVDFWYRVNLIGSKHVQQISSFSAAS